MNIPKIEKCSPAYNDGWNNPLPKAFPTEGPLSMRFIAYDPDAFDVCEDVECSCRMARGNTRGFGSTEEEAIQDFWDKWLN